MIQNIGISRLEEHPDNPRKEIGDITELCESIKKSGILQNLTVVPHPDKFGYYRVLIGHRRLNAARAAGMDELPCVIIEDMPYAEQVATMLAENMQREDLTVFEQASGIQMMLDFGETVESVSDKTGLSKSTVYKRKKLMELDRDKLRESMGRCATLFDYEKLEKIKDIAVRNRVLETIGTNNFDNALHRALDEQKKAEGFAKIVSQVEVWAKRVDAMPEHSEVFRSVYGWNLRKSDTVDPGDGRDYTFTTFADGLIIYVPESATKMQEAQMRRDKQEDVERRKHELEEISERASDLREEFIYNFGDFRGKQAEIKLFLLWSIFINKNGFYNSMSKLVMKVMNALGMGCEREKIVREFGGYYNTNRAYTEKMVADAIEKDTDALLLYTAYENFLCEDSRYHDYDAKYIGNQPLTVLYRCLASLGYLISDEERKWMDGTHELYIREDEA